MNKKKTSALCAVTVAERHHRPFGPGRSEATITTQSVDDVVQPEGLHNNQKERKIFFDFFVFFVFLFVFDSWHLRVLRDQGYDPPRSLRS
jgi:hypothetical protein